MTPDIQSLRDKAKAAVESGDEYEMGVQSSFWRDFREAVSPSAILSLIEALEKTEADSRLKFTATQMSFVVEKASALERELAEAREALKPFSEEAFRYEPPEDDDDNRLWDCRITIGDLRRAARALKTGKSPPPLSE